MMGPTVRRGLAAVSGQPRSCDPRYDYASARLCELLAVDRHLAISLGLQQLLPADLRASRNRQRRIERCRAAGVMPRAIWLAAHPISREKPWLAEGICRATWYRRRAQARQRRLQHCVEGLMAGSADVCGLGETGAVPLYKGEALPPPEMGRTLGSIPDIPLPICRSQPIPRKNDADRRSTTPGATPRRMFPTPAARTQLRIRRKERSLPCRSLPSTQLSSRKPANA